MILIHLIQNQHLAIAHRLQRAIDNHAIHTDCTHTIAIVRGDGDGNIGATFNQVFTQVSHRTMAISRDGNRILLEAERCR